MPTSPSSGFRLWFARFPLNPPNRRMRTRMYGGVAGESGRPLPLCRFAVIFAGAVGSKQRGKEFVAKIASVRGHRRHDWGSGIYGQNLDFTERGPVSGKRQPKIIGSPLSRSPLSYSVVPLITSARGSLLPS